MVRVRFAPSPTGYLHIGSARTALYNYLFAKHHNGVFILRVEDTDQTRLVPGAIKNMLHTLKYLGIAPDEGVSLNDTDEIIEIGACGPYIQSNRLEIYQKYINILLETGNVYRCFCTAEELDKIRAERIVAKLPAMYDGRCRKLSHNVIQEKLNRKTPFVIRLKVPADVSEFKFNDLIRGEIKFAREVIDDAILIKSDGFPVYHFAVVIDDHLMKITHVIRADEWIVSTPKHLLLYQAFGWEAPQFAHIPLVLNPDRSKLSKRQGDVAVEDYLIKGYLPNALINFLALIGWNPKDDQELYLLQELIEHFDISKVNKSGGIFNLEKLNWFNREYIKQMDENHCGAVAVDIQSNNLQRYQKENIEKITKAVLVEKDRIVKLADLPDAIYYLFDPNFQANATIIPAKKSTPEIAKDRLEKLKTFFESLDENLFEKPRELEIKTIEFIKTSGFTNSECLWPLRVSLAGATASPGPFDVMWALGRNEALRRISVAISRL